MRRADERIPRETFLSARLSAAVVSDLVEIDCDLATGRLSASSSDDEPGLIAREGMNIDSVQQEPHSSKEHLLVFVTIKPVSEPNVRTAIEKINEFSLSGGTRDAAAEESGDRAGNSQASRMHGVY